MNGPMYKLSVIWFFDGKSDAAKYGRKIFFILFNIINDQHEVCHMVIQSQNVVQTIQELSVFSNEIKPMPYI